jgi:hypothetical protein
MHPKLKLRIVASAAVSFGLVLVGAPAQAKSEWSTPKDSRQDSVYGINIKRSTLDVRKAGYYRIKILGYKFVRNHLSVATVHLDTVRHNPGPEYLVAWGLPYDGMFNFPFDGHWDGNDYRSTLQRVDTWFDQNINYLRGPAQASTRVSCPRMRLSKNLEKGVVTFLIPRRCVGRPGKVRWNVETWRVNWDSNEAYEADIDAAPGIRMFTRPVA